ncbi:MAG: response regulator [Desulfobacterales bacterium]|nr:response regulator [Desulfobacterales bacterium]MCP4162329.1 response regulator [Deltaproteobacteria bacterium]
MSYNILIVDDSFPMRSVIIKTIKASGFGSSTYFQAGNGIEALKVLKEEWLDIVITDYNMPEMDGIELIKQMKKDDVFSKIPVLFITTEGNIFKIEEFKKSGATGYIKKPFTPEEIKQKLTEILGEPTYEEFSDESDEGLDF